MSAAETMAQPSGHADRFMGVKIEQDAAFDATQYSFFGDLTDGALEGALEDGLEAPPGEEGLLGGLEEDTEPAAVSDAALGDLTLLGLLGSDDLNSEAELEAAMARSLPKHMFGDDGDSPANGRRQAAGAPGPSWAQPSSQPSELVSSQPAQSPPAAVHTPCHHTLHPAGASNGRAVPATAPPAPRPRPMTLAEVEAEIAAGAAQQVAVGGGTAPPPHQVPQPPQFYSPHPHQQGGISQEQLYLRAPAPPLAYPAHGPGQPPPPYLAGGPPPPGMYDFRGPPLPTGRHNSPLPPSGPHGPMHAAMGPPQYHAQLSGPGLHGAPHAVLPAQGHLPPPGPGGLHPPSTPGIVPYGQQGGFTGLTPGASPRQSSNTPRRRHTAAGVSTPLTLHTPPAAAASSSGRTSPNRSIDGRRDTPSGGMGGGRNAGRWMAPPEVDHVMRIMYAAVHAGVPYLEDYAYQAYVHKHTGGRNVHRFRPEALRGLQPDVARLDPSFLVRFAAVDGLGKIVLSNINTPKVLMDMTAGAPSRSSGSAESSDLGAPAQPVPAPTGRRLDQEPFLAARIMVEDCHDKLLDVDDIDRCLAAVAAQHGGGPSTPGHASTPPPPRPPESPAALRQRRALLAAAVTRAFRVPASPLGAGLDPSAPDGVFLNVAALPKGRTMLARAIRVLLAHAPAESATPRNSDTGTRPPTPPAAGADATAALARPEHLMWALMRNAGHIFGSSCADPDARAGSIVPLVEATHRLAAAAREALAHTASPGALVDAAEALGAWLGEPSASTEPRSPIEDLLPLAQVRKLPARLADATPPDWMGEVLLALLHRGEALVPDSGDGGGLGQRWAAAVARLLAAYLRHASALVTLHREVVAAAGPGGGPPAETLAALTALACRPLARQLLTAIPDEAAREQLKLQLRQLL